MNRPAPRTELIRFARIKANITIYYYFPVSTSNCFESSSSSQIDLVPQFSTQAREAALLAPIEENETKEKAIAIELELLKHEPAPEFAHEDESSAQSSSADIEPASTKYPSRASSRTSARNGGEVHTIHFLIF